MKLFQLTTINFNCSKKYFYLEYSIFMKVFFKNQWLLNIYILKDDMKSFFIALTRFYFCILEENLFLILILYFKLIPNILFPQFNIAGQLFK